MPTRISKKYIPNKKEKYMCEKHKAYFKQKLTEWKNEIIKSNSQALYSSNLAKLYFEKKLFNSFLDNFVYTAIFLIIYILLVFLF